MVTTRQSSNRNISRDATLRAYVNGWSTNNRRASRAQLAKLVADKLLETVRNSLVLREGYRTVQVLPSFIRGTETGIHLKEDRVIPGGNFTVAFDRLRLPRGTVVAKLASTYLREGRPHEKQSNPPARHVSYYEVHGVLVLAGMLSDNYTAAHFMWLEVSDDVKFKSTWRELEREELIELMTPPGDKQKPYLLPFGVLQGLWDLFISRADHFQSLANVLRVGVGVGTEEMKRLKGITFVD